MRTSLVNPPQIDGEAFIREGRCMQSVDSWAAIWPPLTLGILASIARQRGQVDLFDCNVEEGYDIARTVERVAAFRPDVVVVNTAFPSIEADAACAAAIKAACPDTLVVGFGVFFTLLDEKALDDFRGFDVGIRGEPEETFEELIRIVEAGSRVEKIAGLMWREGEKVCLGEPRPFIGDLDQLPFAARDLLPNERYTLPTNGHPFTLINVARGCPYPCTFCIAPVYYGRPLRRHSLEYVLNELEHCQKELGIYDFLFWEEIFTLDRKFGMALCQAILDRGWQVAWATTTRADRVDEEILALMKRAGCELLGLGIESSSQEILDNVQKRESVEDIRKAVKLAQKVGLKTMGHFIFGLPGETPATADATIKFGVALGLDYMQCYGAVPYPKTELGELARKKGWITSERWADYDFGGQSIMNIGSIAPERVDKARRNMFRSFYLRPFYVLRRLGDMLGNPRQILQASKFLKWMRTRERTPS
ncbi:MAG: radical SAM protein [Deltaproteobacteria bacterium]|nr:radical SAM protein [Deltaproteobacteria bacterium]